MKTRKTVLNLLVVLVFVVSILILYRQLKDYRFQDIINSLRLISFGKLFLSGIFTALNYLVVCGYDLLAFRYLGVALKLKNILYAAFVGNAVSNVAGYAMLSGGAMRYRLYSTWHVSLRVTAQVVFFISLMVWAGLLAVGGILFVVEPAVVSRALSVADVSVRLAGVIFISIIVGYIMLSITRKEPVSAGKLRFRVPSPDVAVKQVLISSADWLLAALALYVLLPRTATPFFVFLAVFLLAQFLGIISQVPAGLGVFDTTMILVFPRTHTSPEIFAALLAFRIIYYLFPFAAAMTLVAAKGLTSAGK